MNFYTNGIEKRYVVETKYDYARWLSTFQKMMTSTERYGNASEKMKGKMAYYAKLIETMKMCLLHKKRCCVVEADENIIAPFTVVMC